MAVYLLLAPVENVLTKDDYAQHRKVRMVIFVVKMIAHAKYGRNSDPIYITTKTG